MQEIGEAEEDARKKAFEEAAKIADFWAGDGGQGDRVIDQSEGMNDEDLRELERTDPERAARWRTRFGQLRSKKIRIAVVIDSHGGWYAQADDYATQDFSTGEWRGTQGPQDEADARKVRLVVSVNPSSDSTAAKHIVIVEALVPIPEQLPRPADAAGDATEIHAPS